MRHPNIDLAVSYYEALNRRDFAFYDTVLAADVALSAPGDVLVHGTEAVRFFDQIWTNAFSDFTIVEGFHVADDQRVVCYNTATGTHDGTLLMPDGSEVPATGRRLEAPYFAAFDVRDGQLATELIYFDRMRIAEGLGLVPAHAA